MVKYYNNDENCGLVYDWAAVAKEFAGLKAPAGYYDPLAALATGARWNVAASVRSVGKTTSVLLLGMILNKMYGTCICYLRSRDSEIAQSLSEELFNTICSYDHGRYITYCTNGYYNSIYYKWRKLYYCRRDDEGNVIERMQQPFVYFLSLDKCYAIGQILAGGIKRAGAGAASQVIMMLVPIIIFIISQSNIIETMGSSGMKD